MLLYFVNKKENAQKNRNVYKSTRNDSKRNDSKRNDSKRNDSKRTKTKLVTFEEKLLMLFE